MVFAPQMHLHEERSTLQITQEAILNGRTFEYIRKAVYLLFTSIEVLRSFSLVDSFSGYWFILRI
jgi:hypothetical protein